MPRRYPLMSQLLGYPRDRDQDRAAREAVQEAVARRDLNYERLGYPLRTKKEND